MQTQITTNGRTGYVPEDELILIADESQELGVAGTTTVPCAIAGGAIAVSAALPDFCPSGACTTRC